MVSITVNDFDLGQIAESGQCFRMNYIGRGSYSMIAFDKYMEVSQLGNNLIFFCFFVEYEGFWKDYFDIDTDYTEIKRNAKCDVYLSKAIQYAMGIRILKQDLFEMLITFIISQRKSIPSIKKCVKTLFYRYGKEISGLNRNGSTVIVNAFPTPEDLSRVSISDLRECGLGYRDVYVYDAAKWFCKEYPKIDIERFKKEYPFAKNVLQSINGVGDKIANCVCLFALHQLQACPIDTHMHQIIDKEYHGIMPEWMVSDKAGVFQQYCFYYKRNYME